MLTSTNKIINELTLEEKAQLLTGKNFWETKGIDKYNIKSLMLADGPHGVRKQVGSADHLGLNESLPSVCFPTASAVACSFNEKLAQEMGSVLGHGAKQLDVDVLLGPGNNIKRSPLCGRNFEYFSEDPYLAGKLASAMIKGIQSKHVGASLKHFAANNQENHRMVMNSLVDERTLREIYLAAFEIPVIEASPWTVMSAYNLVNGEYASENSRLINDILRKEWGFDGLVVTDWGGNDELHKSVAGGTDLEMPSSGEVGVRDIIKAHNEGRLSMTAIDSAVGNLLQLVQRCTEVEYDGKYSLDSAHDKAREMAEESIVLLKNDQQILPINKARCQNVAVIGSFAKTPRYQGSGSSKVNPHQLTNLFDSLVEKEAEINFSYATGYAVNTDKTDSEQIAASVELAANTDMVILCVGLTDSYESEGFDRSHLNMPQNQLDLIDAVSNVNDNVVIVLSNGSVVKMPFIAKVPAIVEGWLTGEAGASAMANILLGQTNPSGRLAESFILDENDDPAKDTYSSESREAVYSEGIFVGYRSHQNTQTAVQFPFGYGLSYTTFTYRDLLVTKTGDDSAEVSVSITNTGTVAGKEVVQLYVSEINPIISRPLRELKRFAKIALNPGETKRVNFTLDKRSFAHFNTSLNTWHVSDNQYRIEIAKSCEKIVVSSIVKMGYNQATPACDTVYQGNVAFEPKQYIHRNSTVRDLAKHPVGRFLYKKIITGASASVAPKEGDSAGAASLEATIQMTNELPLRNLVSFSGGKDMDENALAFIIKVMNATNTDKLLGKLLNIFNRDKY